MEATPSNLARWTEQEQQQLLQDSAAAGPMLQFLRQHMQRLRAAYDHGNRTLHFDTLLTSLVTAFFCPLVRSLRAIEDFSTADPDGSEGLRLCRSTLSAAMAQFDPEHLRPVVVELLRYCPQLKSQDEDLLMLTRKILAGDGSYFTVPADVLWGIGMSRRNGCPGREVRLNLQLDVLRFLPERLSVSGGEEGFEPDAFGDELASGVVYLVDRAFCCFDFWRKVMAADSDFVVRLKKNVKFTVTQERLLDEEARAAGVISDRIGKVPGSRWTPGFGDLLFREVVVIDPGSGKQVRLLTTLMDLPTHLIGKLYRHRWSIELFFRWFKCVAKCDRAISHSRNGVSLQFYTAIIATLLTCIVSGRRLSKYNYNCLAWVQAGRMTPQQMQAVLQRREHEAELARKRYRRRKLLAGKKSV